LNILITGGARSGKSSYAQEIALKEHKKTLFVATAEAGDEEMAERIRAHKRSRPAGWITLEAPTHTGDEILNKTGDAEIIIVDCVTMLVNNIFAKYADYSTEKIDSELVDREVTREIHEIIGCFSRLKAGFIIVTNEVGMGLVPANPIDRLYRDLLGKANRMLAEKVDEVYLMVAGIAVKVK
jgi:adenosylcobinamide kinase / adenosylcobinamide-phosphate guanylyltransferase